MSKVKLLGLFVVVLLSSVCLVLGSSLMPAINTEKQNYTAVSAMPPISSLQAINFDPISTPTPTPEPTVTPTPTPKPEPTIRPDLEFSCRSISANSLRVEVGGMLSYNNSAIPNARVFIRSSADNGENWEDFALEQTRADGSFSVPWIPKTTGSYLLSAHWSGNDTLRWMNTTISLALTTDSSGNVFAASSNSIITNLKYNTATQTLSFNTNTTQTSTPLNIYMSKEIINNAQSLQIKIDGKAATFSSKSQDDIWIITCQTDQGRQTISAQLPSITFMDPASTPWLTIAIIVVALIIIVTIVTTIRRRRKTAATVAAILKESRQ